MHIGAHRVRHWLSLKEAITSLFLVMLNTSNEKYPLSTNRCFSTNKIMQSDYEATPATYNWKTISSSTFNQNFHF